MYSLLYIFKLDLSFFSFNNNNNNPIFYKTTNTNTNTNKESSFKYIYIIYAVIKFIIGNDSSRVSKFPETRKLKKSSSKAEQLE